MQINVRTLIVLCGLFAMFSCKQTEDCCDDADINKEWMKARIDEINNSELKQYFYIVKAEYEGECITYVNNCCPMCSTMIVPYRCDGTKMEGVDLTRITNHTTAWKPDNFSCSL